MLVRVREKTGVLPQPANCQELGQFLLKYKVSFKQVFGEKRCKTHLKILQGEDKVRGGEGGARRTFLMVSRPVVGDQSVLGWICWM